MWSSKNPIVALLTVAVATASAARAQQTWWAVDGPSSLAWWQINPHRQLLWGTTCPDDPAWRPGEGAAQSDSKHPFGEVDADTLYARHGGRRPETACATSVSGMISAGDTAAWRDARGTIAVQAHALVTGLRMRDRFTRTVVLEADRYPEIRFTIDSLVGIEPGETIRALAVGTFELRGVRAPLSVPISVTRCADGLRVRGAFEIPVRALTRRCGVSGYALGLATQSGVWKGIEVGVDVVLTPAPAAIASSR